jgi:hypothetical protein
MRGSAPFANPSREVVQLSKSSGLALSESQPPSKTLNITAFLAASAVSSLRRAAYHLCCLHVKNLPLIFFAKPAVGRFDLKFPRGTIGSPTQQTFASLPHATATPLTRF